MTTPIVPRGPEFISYAPSVWVGTQSTETHFNWMDSVHPVFINFICYLSFVLRDSIHIQLQHFSSFPQSFKNGCVLIGKQSICVFNDHLRSRAVEDASLMVWRLCCASRAMTWVFFSLSSILKGLLGLSNVTKEIFINASTQQQEPKDKVCTSQERFEEFFFFRLHSNVQPDSKINRLDLGGQRSKVKGLWPVILRAQYLNMGQEIFVKFGTKQHCY